MEGGVGGRLRFIGAELWVSRLVLLRLGKAAPLSFCHNGLKVGWEDAYAELWVSWFGFPRMVCGGDSDLMNEGHCGGSAFAVFGGRGRTVLIRQNYGCPDSRVSGLERLRAWALATTDGRRTLTPQNCGCPGLVSGGRDRTVGVLDSAFPWTDCGCPGFPNGWKAGWADAYAELWVLKWTPPTYGFNEPHWDAAPQSTEGGVRHEG